MDWLRFLVYNFLQRLRSTWMVLILTAFAVLASATLVSTVFIYSKFQAEAGLKHDIASSSSISIHTQIMTPNRLLGSTDYERLRVAVEGEINEHIGELGRSQQRLGRSQRFRFVTRQNQVPSFTSPAAFFTFRTGLAENVDLMQGRHPQTLPFSGPNLELEAIVGVATAQMMRWNLDTIIYIVPFFDDPSEKIKVHIVGLIEPSDSRAVYWMGDLTDFTVSEEDDHPVVPLIIPEEVFFKELGDTYPFFTASYWWTAFLDTEQLTPGTVESTKSQLHQLEADINKQFSRSLVLTGLDEILTEYQRDVSLARVPLFLFTSLVIGVVLFLLMVSVNIVVQVRKEEAYLLKSRGATIAQATMLFTLVEGVIIVLLAIVIAPLLALVLNRLWLADFIDPPTVESGSIPVSLPPEVFLLSAGVGALALIVFLVATLSLIRRSPSESVRERARPPTVPLVHRYYLDGLVLALGALVWWQAKERGGFVGSGLLGDLAIDSSLLISPALMLLGASLVFLRLFPLILRFLGWGSEMFNAPWADFAIKRMARNPILHGSLAITILAMTALGIFGAIFEPTLSRSQEDQVLYGQGADITISRLQANDKTETILQSIQDIGTISPLRRETARLTEGAIVTDVKLLAVAPSTVAETVWFRSDFADKDLPALLSAIDAPLPKLAGVPIPGQADTVGVWVLHEAPEVFQRQSVNVWARVVNAAGHYRNLRLGELSQPGWQLMKGPITEDRDGLQLVSLAVSGSSLQLLSHSFHFDEISVWGPRLPAGGEVIEDFEEFLPWTSTPTTGQVVDVVERTRGAARSGNFGLQLTLGQSRGVELRGAFLPSGPHPVPVLGGPGFSVGQRFVLRAGRSNVQVEVVDVVRYFPTLDPSVDRFMIINLEHYARALNHLSPSQRAPVNEIWISPDPGSGRIELLDTLSETLPATALVKERTGAVASALRDPLATGAWKGLTVMGVVVMGGSVVIGLALVGVVSFRKDRLDISVTRALGFSSRQVAASLIVERVLMAVLATLAGTGVGVWLGRWTLQYLDITPTGRAIVPPLVLTVSPSLLALAYLGLVLAIMANVGLSLFLARRLTIAEGLRQTE